MNYHQKIKKDRCPTCQQVIAQYLVINTQTLSESTPFDFKELLESGVNGPTNNGGNIDDNGSPFECLDHTYFLAEVTKLISLRSGIELDRFHRRISNQDPSRQRNLDLQWTAIKQIELRLFDL